MTETLAPQEILDLSLGSGNDSDAKTVGQYLIRLAQAESKKHPFGNSDWESPLVYAFGEANLMWLRTDEYGQIDDYSSARFEEILNDLYEFLFDVDYSTMDRKLPPPEPKEWYLVCVEREGNPESLLTDYFKEAFTEEEAKTQAEAHNEPYNYHAWVPVHIPPVS